MSLAAQIKTLRMKKGLSLQEMADVIGISKAHLWDMESGRSGNPSMELLKKLSDCLGVSIGQLVGEEPAADAPSEAKAMFRQLTTLGVDDRKLIEGLLRQLHERKTGNQD